MIRFDKKLFVRTPENDFGEDENYYITYRYGKYVIVSFREKTFINKDGSKDVRIYLRADISGKRIEKWSEKQKITSAYLMAKDRRMYSGVPKRKYKAKEFIRLCDGLERLLNCDDKFLFIEIRLAINSDNFCGF